MRLFLGKRRLDNQAGAFLVGSHTEIETFWGNIYLIRTGFNQPIFLLMFSFPQPVAVKIRVLQFYILCDA